MNAVENMKTKTDRIILLKGNRARSKAHRVIREQYLRQDIPCRSELCSLNDCGILAVEDKKSRLPADVTHYLVPCIDVAEHYLEILEFADFVGIIFMQSVVTKVLNDVGKRVYNRICRKIRDVNAKSIYFPNEFNFYTYLERETGESPENWIMRNIYQASLWFYQHLNEKISIILLTENNQVIEKFKSVTVGLHVMTIGEYLACFWSHLTPVLDLYDSLSASWKKIIVSDQADYSQYLPSEVLLSEINTGRYFQGILHVNKHHAQEEAFVSSSKKFTKVKDILIPGMKLRNRAIHGDLVVIELLPENQWCCRQNRLGDNVDGSNLQSSSDGDDSVMSTGRVVGVLQRGWRDYAASFPDNEDGSQRKSGEAILVIPFDYRIPKIRILTRQAENLKNDRIIVRIDSWNMDSQYPNGHFVRTLGKIGDLETEIATLLVEHEVETTEFSNKILAEMPSLQWQVEADEVERRRDLRDTHLIFSIDPRDCEDVDDCLSTRVLPDGNLELGVHIADVTFFVPPDSATDIEARNRSTTVYMADRRFDMLPRVLNSNTCSLLSRVDRYSVSVLWVLNERFEVLDVWYGRTVIRSAYKLFYEAAQEILDGSDLEDLISNISELQECNEELRMEKFDALKSALNRLKDIGTFLKAQRLQEGALELESNEVQFEFSKSSEGLENIKPKQVLPIHEIVAECMIFANHWVAKKIHEAFPQQSILRFHPPPQEEFFQDLLLSAKSKGFAFNTTNNKTLGTSLNNAIDTSDPYVNMLVRMLATRAMSVAQYFSTGSFSLEEFYHYGLGLDKYTHFTSPIRRYADVLVHRLLLSAINDNCNLSHLLGNIELQELCDHINAKHRAAQNIQKDSQQLFQIMYFQDKKPDDERCIVDAIIFSLRNNGLLVYIPRYGIKGPLYLRDKENQVAFFIDGKVEWVPGKLHQHSCTLSVETAFGTQDYNLFEHITAQIELIKYKVHPNILRMSLLKKEPLLKDVQAYCQNISHILPPISFVKELENNLSDSRIERSKSPDLKHELSNFYVLLEHFQKLTLQVLTEDEFCRHTENIE